MFRHTPRIHKCARAGDVAGVLGELARGVSVDARDPATDRTPLMEAVSSEKATTELVHLLISKGADVNATATDPQLGLELTHAILVPEVKDNVLSLAASAGYVDRIEALLDAGADIGYVRPHGYDVLVDAMHGRLIARDPELVTVVKSLIARGARLDTVSDYAESALSVASNWGRFDVVRVLLEAGADPAPLQWTPIMRAIALGTVADVAELLKAGPDLSARDFWSRTPWLLSLQVGDVSKAKPVLAAGANRADRGRCGKTPLMYPIANNHTEMLSWLLSEGFNPNDADDFKHTALTFAAELGATECARILLDGGADVHLVDDAQQMAIARASALDIALLLVQHGADLNDISPEPRASLLNLPRDGNVDVSREEYLAAKCPRFGEQNPQNMNFPFWLAMVRAGASAYQARSTFDDTGLSDRPVWCYRRFGQSTNILPDGRIVEIGGEHEDFYDPDFCIYNDVVVHHGDGTFDIYGYPEEAFPPTDFHTATLVPPYIYIIGGLRYQGQRGYGETPVYRLNIDSLRIEALNTSGTKPGWIFEHKAQCSERGSIRAVGGKVCSLEGGAETQHDNLATYELDLATLVWRRM